MPTWKMELLEKAIMVCLLLVAYKDGAAQSRLLQPDHKQERVLLPSPQWFDQRSNNLQDGLVQDLADNAVFVGGLVRVSPGHLSDDVLWNQEEMHLQSYFNAQH